MVISLKLAAIGQYKLANIGGLITEGDYNSAIKKQMEYDESLTLDKAKASYPVTEFLIDKYADFVADKIDSFVSKRFKEILNP